MSWNRRDLHKAKLRRDRLRREKHNQRAGSPATPEAGLGHLDEHPFASERAHRQVQALMEGQKFESLEQANARLAELTAGGRLSEIANAWNRADPKWRAQELAY